MEGYQSAELPSYIVLHHSEGEQALVYGDISQQVNVVLRHEMALAVACDQRCSGILSLEESCLTVSPPVESLDVQDRPLAGQQKFLQVAPSYDAAPQGHHLSCGLAEALLQTQ